MIHRHLSLLAAATSLGLSSSAFAVDVLTHHNDHFRTGLNASETILKPSNVNVATFGKLFTQPVDGEVYAQPLIMSGVAIPGKGTHDVVFIATEHDSVYAFDADDAVEGNAEPLWHRSFIDPAHGITTVDFLDVGSEDIHPEIGITGTPVIDPASGTLFCDAKTKENGRFVHRLHALDVRTGAERPGSPKNITATVNGTGAGSAGGKIVFDPLIQHQRAGLLLLKGVVYLAWSAHGVNGPYHGWIMGYNAKTLAQVAVFNTTPNAGRGGIWGGGGGLAADESGNIFVSTGNGDFSTGADGQHVGSDYGDSVVKLATSSTGALSLVDYFTPSNQAARNEQDRDLGSSAVMLIPQIPGISRQFAIVSGKAEIIDPADSTKDVASIYLLDRSNLGGYDPAADHVVQKLDNAIKGGFGMPAFFNNSVYYHGTNYGGNDVLKAFDLSTGLLSTQPTSHADETKPFAFPGATPGLSANGTADGIVWEIERRGVAILHASDASNVANELYRSDLAPDAADEPGDAVKFTVPTVANGRVYVGCINQFSVFGLRDDRKPPLVKFFTPAEGARTDTAALAFTGTASDATGVAALEFRIENADGPGTFQNVPLQRARAADGWSFDATLIPGVNTIHVRATDRAGNVSADVLRRVTFVKFGPLAVSIAPPNGGRVTPGFLGSSSRQLGIDFTITATANAGFAFDRWSGTRTSPSVALTFSMQENETLVANFVASPFLAEVGNFNGGIASDDPLKNGPITFTLTGTGAFTVRATIAGLPYSGKGIVQTDGDAVATVSRGTSSLPLVLHLDLGGGTERITGSLGGSNFATDRAVFTSSNVSGLRGYYTVSLAPDPLASTPQGAGFATAHVDDLGHVRVAGVLADGAPFSQGAFLSKTKSWQLSVPLYALRGVLAGDIAFSGAAPAAISGALLWIKPTRPLDRLFPGGFTAHPALTGSLYDPARTPNVLGLGDVADNARLILAGGNPIVGKLTKTNVATFAGGNPPGLAITAATGLVRGSFLPAGATVRTFFSGVAVQNGSFAAGYFLEPQQSRAFRFEAKE